MLQRGTSDRGHGTFFTEQNPRENTAVTIMEENIDLIFSQPFAAASPATATPSSTLTGPPLRETPFHSGISGTQRKKNKNNTTFTTLPPGFKPASFPIVRHLVLVAWHQTADSSPKKHRSGTVPLPDFEATAANEKWLLQTLLTVCVCEWNTPVFSRSRSLTHTLD